MQVEHPAAKMLVMASQQQEQEAGDMTNWVLVFAGALLENAEELLRMVGRFSRVLYLKTWDYHYLHQFTLQLLPSVLTNLAIYLLIILHIADLILHLYFNEVVIYQEKYFVLAVYFPLSLRFIPDFEQTTEFHSSRSWLNLDILWGWNHFIMKSCVCYKFLRDI